MKENVVTIVVTYNRLNLLKENIDALLLQTVSTDILIIDNNSTDGTREYIDNLNNEKIKYKNTGKNLGGAGGFAYGIKKATEMGYKYAWIMDDDSIPESNALEMLMDVVGTGIPFSFLASMVYWTDGRIFPMNRPTIQTIKDENVSMIRNCKVFPIENCSFVGCFFPLNLTYQVGLPISEFFIYGDDSEYTRRLRRIAPAYWVMNSEIVHKAPTIDGADIATADYSRIQRFFYQVRNGIYISRKSGYRNTVKYIGKIFKRIGRVIRLSKDHKIGRILTLVKGSIKGFSFNPEIEFPQPKKNELSAK